MCSSRSHSCPAHYTDGPSCINELVDTKKRTVSTTKASGLDRSTEFTMLKREDGLISVQGVEAGRAFSFVIDELTGRLTAAIARDGLTVTVFGACTDADL